jgi:uncharacterized protein (DUF2164 family)
MRNSNKITVSREKRDDMVSALKNYFSKERDEELGDLAASLILAFIIEELAPEFYNQGVYDSYQYLQDMMEDLLSLQK